MCDQPVMSAAAETVAPKKQDRYFTAGCTSVGLEREKRAFTPSSRAIFTLQISSCMIREMLSNKETMARLCLLSWSTSNSPFDASHLEQHIRGRSVLGDLLQTGVHKIAEIVRPGNNEGCYNDARKCHKVQYSCICSSLQLTRFHTFSLAFRIATTKTKSRLHGTESNIFLLLQLFKNCYKKYFPPIK